MAQRNATLFWNEPNLLRSMISVMFATSSTMELPRHWPSSSQTYGTEASLPRCTLLALEKEASMKVKDVMHRGVAWVEPQTPIAEIARKMRDEDIGAVPVGENDRLVGMVTDRDIVTRGLAKVRNYMDLVASDVMTKPIVYARADEDVEDALHIMAKNQIRRLPVIDENKRLVGMLSLGDISEKAGRDLTGEVMRSVSAHHA